jgi:hypothetical protein
MCSHAKSFGLAWKRACWAEVLATMRCVAALHWTFDLQRGVALSTPDMTLQSELSHGPIIIGRLTGIISYQKQTDGTPIG